MDLWPMGFNHQGPLSDSVPGNITTTEVLAVPGRGLGAIDTPGDQDWYRVTLTAGVVYSFSMVRLDTVDAVLTLYNSAGVALVIDDEPGLVKDAFISNFIPTFSGTYYLGASGHGSTVGDYLLISSAFINPDTIAANTSTTGALIVDGASVNSTIDLAGDHDWFAVTLQAGHSYAFSVTGAGASALSDPFLEVYGPSGQLLSIDDDGGDGVNALMHFTATFSGTYYLSAEGLGNATGDYTIAAASGPPQDPLNTIDLGFTFHTNSISIYFATTGQQFGPSGTALRSWTSAEQASVLSALGSISNVANLTFSLAASAATADFVFTLSDLPDGVLGQTWPDASVAYLEFAPDAPGWSTAGLAPGGLGYSVLIHEVGHALGLDHPQLDGGDNQVMQGVLDAFNSYGTFALNQQVFTIMSYNDGWPLGPDGAPVNFTQGYAASPMALDIAYLQMLYGANATRNSGNTIYTISDASSSYSAIWDTGGVDTISYSGARNAVIDLHAATLLSAPGGGGFVSYARGALGGYTIAAGVVIENAVGGSGNDLIIGNDASNLLNGSDGNDTLSGGGGTDTLLGGAGDDTLMAKAGDTIDGGAGADFVQLDLSSTNASIVYDMALAASGAGFNIAGGSIRNTEAFQLQTGAGDDTLLVAGNISGQSYWFAGAGSDRIIVDFSSVTSDTDVGLGLIHISGGGMVSLSGVEAADVRGGSGSDQIGGGNLAETLSGNGGDDVIFGGGGDDVIDGGAGNDQLSGGDGNDTLRGGAGNDRIEGNLGADTILGEAGDDVLDGGNGTAIAAADFIDGGDGRDKFVLYFGGETAPITFMAAEAASSTGVTFSSGAHVQNVEMFDLETGSGNDQVFANDVNYGSIWRAGAGTDRLVLDLSAVAAPITMAYSDADLITRTGLRVDVSWSGVGIIALYAEQFSVTGGSAGDTLVGNAFDDVLNGNGGADTLIGGAGNDTLDGGAGADKMDGGDGNDTIFWDASDDLANVLGGNGADVLVFTSGA
ncbi:MAG: M10 family metallopeptidase, partial [Vitreimonas sp.]